MVATNSQSRLRNLGLSLKCSEVTFRACGMRGTLMDGTYSWGLRPVGLLKFENMQNANNTWCLFGEKNTVFCSMIFDMWSFCFNVRNAKYAVLAVFLKEGMHKAPTIPLCFKRQAQQYIVKGSVLLFEARIRWYDVVCHVLKKARWKYPVGWKTAPAVVSVK